jgi:hypothetical protein
VKKLLVVPMLLGLVLAWALPAFAVHPGPSDEVEIIPGNCDDGTTIVRAHNTQDIELGYLIRINDRLVEQGRLAPGERVERTYEVPLGESQFFRVRLGLTGDGRYFSWEATTDRTNCPSPSESQTPTPSETETPTPSETETPTPSETETPSIGGGGSHTPSTSVLGGSETRSPGSGGTAFTGSEVGWLIAAGLGLLLLGAAALRLASRSTR